LPGQASHCRHALVLLKNKLEAKVLITGASGFVGGRLREALLEAGADVIAIRRPSSPAPKTGPKTGRSAVADYADLDALKTLMASEKPDYVFHVAGVTKGVSYADFERANVMPTRHLLAALKAEHRDVKRFVLVSSLAAFGPSAAGKPHTESTARRPIEHYGRSKLEAEEMVEAAAGELACTILRPAGVYGPGDGDYFNLFAEVEKGRNAYFGNRNRWFSAVYIDDCVRALVAAAESENTVGKAYFVCDGEPTTWGNFQETIVELSGRRVKTLKLPEFLVGVAAFGGELATKVDGKPRLFNRQKAKMSAQEAWTCHSDKASEDFGYQAQIGLREGIRRSMAWYRAEGWM
jgi:nucleoside-diphosphate-sugar epimerase